MTVSMRAHTEKRETRRMVLGVYLLIAGASVYYTKEDLIAEACRQTRLTANT